MSIRNRLLVRATPAQPTHIQVQALAALYIGDRLGEIAKAIESVVNPTDAEWNERLARAMSVTEGLVGNIVNDAAAFVDEINQVDKE